MSKVSRSRYLLWEFERKSCCLGKWNMVLRRKKIFAKLNKVNLLFSMYVIFKFNSSLYLTFLMLGKLIFLVS